MNTDLLHELILDYLDGNLDASRLDSLGTELENLGYDLNNLDELQALILSMDKIKIPQPSKQMDDKFYQMLDGEIKKLDKSNRNYPILNWMNSFFTNFFAPKLSYSLIMLLIGWIIGFWVTPNSRLNNQMSQINVEMQQMKELVMFKMLGQPNANERLQAVNMIKTSSLDNNRLIMSLLDALNNDSDVNVRMAAAEALLAFANQAQVRTGLKNSVLKQNSPLVQLTLVDGLIAIQDKTAIPVFQNLIGGNNVHQAVKDRSREGITKLI